MLIIYLLQPFAGNATCPEYVYKLRRGRTTRSAQRSTRSRVYIPQRVLRVVVCLDARVKSVDSIFGAQTIPPLPPPTLRVAHALTALRVALWHAALRAPIIRVRLRFRILTRALGRACVVMEWRQRQRQRRRRRRWQPGW